MKHIRKIYENTSNIEELKEAYSVLFDIDGIKVKFYEEENTDITIVIETSEGNRFDQADTTGLETINLMYDIYESIKFANQKTDKYILTDTIISNDISLFYSLK